MLATVHKETGSTFIPNEEIGKGAGHPNYNTVYEVIDVQGYRGPKNARYRNVYYGRGYCHLTKFENYQRVGKALGVGDELYVNPARLLEKQVAYKVMSYGMRHGTFTYGIHKLSDHINGNKCDYLNARQIINGHDRDDEVASFAKTIELLLRICVQQPWSP